MVARHEVPDAGDTRTRHELYDDVASLLVGLGPRLLVIDDLHRVDGRRCGCFSTSRRSWPVPLWLWW